MKIISRILAKIKYKKNYPAKVAAAKDLESYISACTKGGVKLRHNAKGEEIRGWHEKPVHFKVGGFHPLELKYKW
jgi:hypothetical protein